VRSTGIRLGCARIAETLWRDGLHVKRRNDSCLVAPLCHAFDLGEQADAQPDLWQTGCLNGMVFALRVALVRMRSNPARN
jgi:hypothetical protein